MGFDPGDTLRSLFVVKFKPRHDSYSDQLLRIAITRIFILASIIMGVDWFQGEMNCIPPESSTLPVNFIHKGCWVRGFYVYPHLATIMRQSSYYGVPKDLKYDGYLYNDPSHLCFTDQYEGKKSAEGKDICVPMEKQFYTQYQWMPFCVSFLGFLFYFPYMVFRVANTDIISLKWNLRNQATCKQLVNSYFNHHINSIQRNRIRTVTNYIVKILYFANSLIGFCFLNWLTNDRFENYGPDWINFSRNSSRANYDFKLRDRPSPGNQFLPTFAMCDLDDIRYDTIKRTAITVKVVCEISSHILYQYSFIVFWIVIIIAICSSFIGLLVHIGKHVYLVYKMKRLTDAKIFYRYMTARGFEYLDFIRSRDLAMYFQILEMLNESVNDETTVPLTFHPSTSERNGVELRPKFRHMDSIVSES